MRPIDADVLMEEVLKGTIISDDLYGMGIMTGVDSFAKKLKAAPTLTLDDLLPKERAMWIPHYNGGLDRREYRCSKCWNGTQNNQDPRCLNCGSEMLQEL